MTAPSVCPNCGNPLPPDAVSCRHCGSDEHTGWKHSASSEHPDVAPFDEEDYHDAHEKEFGKVPPPKKKTLWKEIALGAFILFLVFMRLIRAQHR